MLKLSFQYIKAYSSFNL